MRRVGCRPAMSARPCPAAITCPPPRSGARAHFHQPVGRRRRMRASWSTITTELPSASRSRMTPSRPSTFAGCRPMRRLVQHVEHAGGAVAHGAGQLHALALAGGERGARAVERRGSPAPARCSRRAVCSERRRTMETRHGAQVVGQRLRHGSSTQAHEPRRASSRHASARFMPAHQRAARAPADRRVPWQSGHGPSRQEAGHARQALLVLGLRQRVLHGVDGVVVGEVELGEGVALSSPCTGCGVFSAGPWKHDVAFLGAVSSLNGTSSAHAHLAGTRRFMSVPHEAVPREPPRPRRWLASRRAPARASFTRAHDAGAAAGRGRRRRC